MFGVLVCNVCWLFIPNQNYIHLFHDHTPACAGFYTLQPTATYTKCLWTKNLLISNPGQVVWSSFWQLESTWYPMISYSMANCLYLFNHCYSSATCWELIAQRMKHIKHVPWSSYLDWYTQYTHEGQDSQDGMDDHKQQFSSWTPWFFDVVCCHQQGFKNVCCKSIPVCQCLFENWIVFDDSMQYHVHSSTWQKHGKHNLLIYTYIYTWQTDLMENCQLNKKKRTLPVIFTYYVSCVDVCKILKEVQPNCLRFRCTFGRVPGFRGIGELRFWRALAEVVPGWALLIP